MNYLGNSASHALIVKTVNIDFSDFWLLDIFIKKNLKNWPWHIFFHKAHVGIFPIFTPDLNVSLPSCLGHIWGYPRMCLVGYYCLNIELITRGYKTHTKVTNYIDTLHQNMSRIIMRLYYFSEKHKTSKFWFSSKGSVNRTRQNLTLSVHPSVHRSF